MDKGITFRLSPKGGKNLKYIELKNQITDPLRVLAVAGDDSAMTGVVLIVDFIFPKAHWNQQIRVDPADFQPISHTPSRRTILKAWSINADLGEYLCYEMQN